MKINKFLTRNKLLFVLLLIIIATGVFSFNISKNAQSSNDSVLADLESAPSELQAGGSIISKNQETLHFQSSGKLAYLPFKEGDQIQQGQVIASLDSTEAQHNLTGADAGYRSAKAALDLVLDNIHLFQYGNGGFANVGTANETQTQKTQRQQAEEVANIAYDNLQKSQKQLQNLSIIAPFDGTLMIEDVKNIEVNVTPATSFMLADLNNLVFQAVVSGNDISSVNIGDKVKIQLDGIKDQQFDGIVSNIYPEKIRLQNGDGYKVDIESELLKLNGKFGTSGSVLFENKLAKSFILPSWVVLGNQYVWVMNQNNPVLKKVTVGEVIGDKVQIINGLTNEDKVILNPETIIEKEYQIL